MTVIALHSELVRQERTVSGPTRAPLLILHGMLGSGTNWRSIARRLSTEQDVYLLDARNHGRSGHADSMDYPSMARDVADWLSANAIERAVLLGHSMGGKTAMQLCLTDPGPIAGLIVVDIAPVAYRHTEHEPLLQAMQDLALGSLSSRTEADQALAAAVPDKALRGFLLHNLTSDNGTLRWRVNLDAIQRHLPDLIDFPLDGSPRFERETLFIRGADSNYIGDSHRQAIDSLFPNARMRTIANAGHWVHAEQPGAFVDAVEPFLAELAP